MDVDSILDRFDPAGRLQHYFELLTKENERINLVSRETPPQQLRRLAAESLLPLTLLDKKFEKYLDIGSGSGLPALPIMLSGQVSGQTFLVERTRKKKAALRRMLHVLNLRADVVDRPFEENEFGARFDLITMRLVKLSRPLLDRVMTLLQADGRFIYYARPEICCASVRAHTYPYSERKSPAYKHFAVIQRN